MTNYFLRLETLKRETDLYFHTKFVSEEAADQENLRIKSELFQLIKDTEEQEPLSMYLEVKRIVIEYLCEICGHSGDLQILKINTPGILTPKEIEYIIQNSALSRWF